MVLRFVKTKDASYIVDQIDNTNYLPKGMVLGTYMRLTNSDKKYPDFIGNTPVQVCRESDVVINRKANKAESYMFSHLKDQGKLTKGDKDYLKKHYAVRERTGAKNANQ